MDGNEGCTESRINLIALNCHLKIANVENFRLYVFYRNKTNIFKGWKKLNNNHVLQIISDYFPLSLVLKLSIMPRVFYDLKNKWKTQPELKTCFTKGNNNLRRISSQAQLLGGCLGNVI